MISVKMEKILDNLTSNYMPFTLLSNECTLEVVNVVRFIEMREGEIVHMMEDTGNSYYIITQGSAEVLQRGIYDDEMHKIAELGEGDAFGCEALISGNARSETVIMLEDSTL
ncbi:MAG: cyclic nucleotide-binding domain-containing protein [Gammaproteobacteria bacterium]|nr:cyclic nucleotide-binding domain-containing protein [Gammaproteobacteria bacterium]